MEDLPNPVNTGFIPQKRKSGRPKEQSQAKSLSKVFDDIGLTNRQIMYVVERFKPENADNKLIAYQKAGYDFKTKLVGQAAVARLENTPKIREAFKRYIEFVLDSEKNKLKLKILNELQVQAFYDPATFFNDDGSLKALTEIPEEYRPCVTQIETKGYGKDASKITNYKLIDKGRALKQLMNYLSLENGGASPSLNSNDEKEKLPTINIKVG